MATRIVVLNKGRVAQWNTPIELYRHPQNSFVAGFIGSPRMNLFPGSIGGDVLAPVFKADAGWSVPLVGRALAAAMGQPATLGIRPEDLRLAASTSEADLDCTISIVERLGAETYLNATNGNDALMVRVQGDLEARHGDIVHLAMNHDAIHLFDQSGTAMAALPHGENQ